MFINIDNNHKARMTAIINELAASTIFQTVIPFLSFLFDINENSLRMLLTILEKGNVSSHTTDNGLTIYSLSGFWKVFV